MTASYRSPWLERALHSLFMDSAPAGVGNTHIKGEKHLMRRKILPLMLGAMLSIAAVAPAAAANNSRQGGLVNVSTGNVDLLNNVNLAVAANVIATVCGVNVPVAVLATQVFADGSQTFCTTTAGPITITQAQPGDGAGTPNGGGGNMSRQSGLVNLSVGDVAILNNLNAAVAANVLVTACGLTVPVAILAVQAIGDATYTACTTSSGPINLDQAQ